LAAAQVSRWETNTKAAKAVYIHADQPDRFAFDAPLQDLAHQQNIPTAVMAAKRLEYRPGTVQTEGNGWPLWLTIRPLLLGLVSLATVLVISRRWHRPLTRRAGGTAQAQA
jgi:hypothetical protein